MSKTLNDTQKTEKGITDDSICRSCSNCLHCDDTNNVALSFCMLSGFMALTERRYPTKCGQDFKGWIPKPKKEGLKKRILAFWNGN